MLADVFLPMGLGSMQLFYSFEPSEVGIDQLVSMIFPYINPTLFTTDNQTSVDQQIVNELTSKIPQWILEYINNKTTEGFKNYIQQKGVDRLFKSHQDRQFNDTGTKVFNDLAFGKVSIVNYPVLRYAGSCDFANPSDGFSTIDHINL